MKKNSFGEKLRNLRKKRGEGIKVLAKSLNVNYTYLSKIENNKATPSEEFIEKIAQVFNYDGEELKIMAGKIPEDVSRILRENPREAIAHLRSLFGDKTK